MTDLNELDKKVAIITLSENKLPQDEYLNLLKASVDELPFEGAKTFLNNPVLIDKNYIQNSTKLCTLLNSILVHVAYNYFRDVNIQEVYQLDRELQEILLMADGIPYEVGMYRPDFIFDLNGHPGICEIGCRFPINGWMFNTYINQAVGKLAKVTNPNWSEVPKQEDFITEFSNRFDADDTLFFIHKKEKGTEVNYLKIELAKKGINLVSIQPEDLKLVEGKLKVGEETARQFYLEMDREELKLFDQNVLRAIISSGRCINDVRTIILIHDKRILAVLNSEIIMSSYLNREEYQFLKTYLIPSYTIDKPEDRDFLISTEANWVLKPNSGGRGIDMLIKNECSKELWEDTIKNKWQNYMVQPYLPQKKFELDYDGSQKSVHLVAIDLCFNGKYFGPGFFRASDENIINVHGGKTVILPCILEERDE